MEWFVSHWLKSSDASGVQAEKLKVLDVGSYDVNGSYKTFFQESHFDYIGLDMVPGPNVDLVPDSPYRWRMLSDDGFDVVISGQALEHIEFFWLVVAEMVRVTKPSGLLCIIAPRGFDEHRYPVDCYRFLADGMVALARYTNLEILHAHCDCNPDGDAALQDWHLDNKEDSLLIARKPYSGSAQLVDIDQYKCLPADLQLLRSPLVPNLPADQSQLIVSSEAIAAESEHHGDSGLQEPRNRSVSERMRHFLGRLINSLT
jgi:SAM-dependent methyltransferase